tara:strand:- start:92 stop:214 length:123 start_codon:yes stop_codon:yes gene_type:complete
MKEIEKLIELIKLMEWDYDRFSQSGQITYDEIMEIINEHS